MRKRGLAILLFTALPLTAVAAPAHAATHSVKVAECRTGDTPESRVATFEGRMKAIKGAVRMQMRYELLAETPGAASPQAVKAPDLSPWRRSKVGVRQFTYAQTVKGLSSGVTYSSRVEFRWISATGKVIREETRTSGTCVQDGDLPNLVLGSVKFGRGSVEGTSVYIVQVGNTGAGDAKSVEVSLFADGAHIDTRAVDSLKSGEFTTVRFTGPRCAKLRAVVDRGVTVPETVEEDNELRARCPVATR